MTKNQRLGKRALALSLVSALSCSHLMGSVDVQALESLEEFNITLNSSEGCTLTSEQEIGMTGDYITVEVEMADTYGFRGIEVRGEESGELYSQNLLNYRTEFTLCNESVVVTPLITTFEERIECAKENDMQDEVDELGFLNADQYRVLTEDEKEKVSYLINRMAVVDVEDELEVSLTTNIDKNTFSTAYKTTYYTAYYHSNGSAFAGGYYKGDTPYGEKIMFCANHPMNYPLVGSTLYDTKEITDENIKKVLYYGYGGIEPLTTETSDFYLETANSVSHYYANSSNTYSE